MRITVVTFNDNEKAAVDLLFEELRGESKIPWSGGNREITRSYGSDTWTIRHRGLLAQGNVVAATALADLYRVPGDGPDYVVFYACAGAVDPGDARSVFLVDSVNYVSLGTVDPSCLTGEKITLKNKWLCDTKASSGVEPLLQETFPLMTGQGSVDVRRLIELPMARIAATDKVIRVPARKAPGPKVPHSTQPEYEAGEWTYAQGIGHVAAIGDTTLVKMESYGIGSVGRSLDILDRVIVMRVTTDSLGDKAKTDGLQGTLLKKGRAALARLLFSLFTQVDEP
jgi:hypothetical protein